MSKELTAEQAEGVKADRPLRSVEAYEVPRLDDGSAMLDVSQIRNAMHSTMMLIRDQLERDLLGIQRAWRNQRGEHSGLDYRMQTAGEVLLYADIALVDALAQEHRAFAQMNIAEAENQLEALRGELRAMEKATEEAMRVARERRSELGE